MSFPNESDAWRRNYSGGRGFIEHFGEELIEPVWRKAAQQKF
jgi:hypothetical protein